MKFKKGDTVFINLPGNPTHGLRATLIKYQDAGGALVKLAESYRAHKAGDKVQVGPGELAAERPRKKLMLRNDLEDAPALSPTGRTPSEPNIQHVPGSPADKIDKATDRAGKKTLAPAPKFTPCEIPGHLPPLEQPTPAVTVTPFHPSGRSITVPSNNVFNAVKAAASKFVGTPADVTIVPPAAVEAALAAGVAPYYLEGGTRAPELITAAVAKQRNGMRSDNLRWVPAANIKPADCVVPPVSKM